MKGEMMPIKDKAYWQVYNQKRKEYLAQKARARRAKEKSIQFAERIQPSPRIQLSNERIQLFASSTTERIQPTKPEERIQPNLPYTTESIQPQLWSSHYSVKKPWCYPCQQKGIPETHYAFCSREKVQDALTIRLPNRYLCNVYHWTLYQGQGRLGGSM